ncbi:E3 UFM1-protein ligase [Nitzschia inconspicua]|uniref:E3 UFM1-protein ligase n=1 Tax=Nitzschia inconspicua TaxID=303405 RepID=A0A9K3KTZ7_9STRA|nr:E3 UFM1-protein ligase [Nitzschia inconspicua]
MIVGGNDDTIPISDDGARQILSQLFRLGYFHCREEDEINNYQDDNSDDDLDSFRKWKSSHEGGNSTPYSWDGYCQVIPTTQQNVYFTQKGLAKELTQQLDGNIHQGRATLPSLCRDLNVDCETVFLSTFQQQQPSTSVSSQIWNILPTSVTVLTRGGDLELVSESYWERTAKEVASRVHEQGNCKVVELSSDWKIPLDVFVDRVVMTNLPSNISYLENTKTLVSAGFLQQTQQQVFDYFRNLKEPIHIVAACQNNGWELEQVLEWMRNADVDEIDGEVHIDKNSRQTAMYVPQSYRQQQEQSVVDFLTANGFVTLDRAPNRNILTALVQDRFPDAFVIGDYDVIILDTVLEEGRAGVSEYLTSSSTEFLDLQEYLPTELLQSHTIQIILSKIGFDESQAVAIATNDQAIIMRNTLIQEIEEKHLTQLVEDFAKSKAEELFRSKNAHVDEEIGDHTTKNKRGGKNKSNRGRGDKQKTTDDNNCMVLLSDVAKAVLDAYPKLQTGGPLPSSIGWEEELDDGGESSNSLVIEFCRKAFYTPTFQKKCKQAVNAELKRLQSEKISKATLSRKDAAAKFRSVEAAFEEAFVTLCYLVQAQSKFLTFASSSEAFDKECMEVLKSEFLKGPCADLTSRITQQCIFKNEQDDLFTFDHPEDLKIKKAQTENGLPDYCSSVDTAARRYPRTFLSCPPPRDPLPVLRENFSGTTGVALSRLWILCGGECYQGGIIQVADEDETEEMLHVRPGNVDGFLSHVEQNSLSLCGLPFKKLDKKSEKNLLFSRKQQVASLLSLSSEPTTILEYTIMILFQQVRQLVVSGSLLRGPILTALSEERKIPEAVATALQILNQAIESGGDAVSDEALLALIKDCGTCKDIAKHDIGPLEAHLSSL